jgi:NTP pyrophosphatase (non-canonical NTP hydrolase)
VDGQHSEAVHTIDEWYRLINQIYLRRNFHRDAFAIFGHLVEVMGGLSLIAGDKSKPGVDPHAFVPKAIAWWLSLCGKIGVRSVSEMLWFKFPAVCPYCETRPHDEGRCRRLKTRNRERLPDWSSLENIGRANEEAGRRPETITEWRKMFEEIYPAQGTETYAPTFSRFTEELGELAEALRVFPVAPGYFLSEATDVFAWLMHIQNLIEVKAETQVADDDLERRFAAAYPDGCRDCGFRVCACPPILPGTLGRIANEISPTRATFAPGGALISVDKAMELFGSSDTVVRFGDEEVRVDVALIRDIHAMIKGLMIFVVEQAAVLQSQSGDIMHVLLELDEMTASQRITQGTIDDLEDVLGRLEPGMRKTAGEIAVGVVSGGSVELVKLWLKTKLGVAI